MRFKTYSSVIVLFIRILSCLPFDKLKTAIFVWILPCCVHVTNANGSVVPFIRINEKDVHFKSIELRSDGSFKRCRWFKTLDFHFHDITSPDSVHENNIFGLNKSNCWLIILLFSMPSNPRMHSPVIVLKTRICSSQITNNALETMLLKIIHVFIG